MAEVDFSHARLASCNANGWSPTGLNHVSFFPYKGTGNEYGKITDVSGNVISTNWSATILERTYNSYIVVYTGTLTASGNGIYIAWERNGQPYWGITNISFQAGDTFTFQVNCSITNSAYTPSQS